MYTVAVIAEMFHKLPNEVIADLERDPDQSAMKCFELLHYARAKAEYDACKGDEKQLKRWKDSRIMDEVTKNHFELFKERRARRAAQPDNSITT